MSLAWYVGGISTVGTGHHSALVLNSFDIRPSGSFHPPFPIVDAV